MRANEFLNDYAVDDLNVFGRHEEHYSLDDLMEEYAKIYHESEIKKFRLDVVIGSFSLPELWKMAQKYNCDDFVKMVQEVNRINDL